MPLDPTALDTTISPGQAGLISDAEVVHAVLNELTSTAGADRVGTSWGGTIQERFDGSLWFFAPQLETYIGSPTKVATTAPFWPRWQFTGTGTQGLVLSWSPPVGVTTIDVYAWVYLDSATTGNYVHGLAYNVGIAAGESNATGAAAGTTTTTASAAQNVFQRILLPSNLSCTPGEVHLLRPYREGGNVADTAGASCFVALELVPNP